jgi:dephospho-CoA kinase
LGLTGNIACGKTAVGRLLAERHGAEYIDADTLVHGLYAADTPETWAIAQRFGAHVRGPDGAIDRRRLSDLVLADPAALQHLEAIVHPAVLRAVEQRVATSRAPVVVVDAIKLIESGLAARFQAVWVVTCDRADQLSRLQKIRGLTPEQAEQRIRVQGSQEEKLRHATAAIENRASLEELARQVEAAWGRTVAPHLNTQR